MNLGDVCGWTAFGLGFIVTLPQVFNPTKVSKLSWWGILLLHIFNSIAGYLKDIDWLLIGSAYCVLIDILMLWRLYFRSDSEAESSKQSEKEESPPSTE